MGDFANMVVAGFKEARDTFGVNFVYLGATYRGVQRDTEEMQLLGSGGFRDDYSGGLEFLSTDVTIPNGAKVTIGSVIYRVEKASDTEDDPVRLMFLIGKEK